MRTWHSETSTGETEAGAEAGDWVVVVPGDMAPVAFGEGVLCSLESMGSLLVAEADGEDDVV